jgi:putative transposase
MGAVELQRPKLRGTDEAFCSRLFGAGATRTNALESLVISGWIRGLSDRDVEATLAEVLGAEAALSKSTVSRICQRIREEFTAWRTRDLRGIRLDYLFLDASHFKMHPGAPAEPVLAAWGIDTDGKPVFVGLGPAASESTDAWDDFLDDLVRRGLGAPLLGISDGAAGLTGAFDRTFPNSLRQRCLVHRARNVLAKVSAVDHDEVRADYWAIFDVGDAQPGDHAVSVARRQAEAFAGKWGSRYPSAVVCCTSPTDVADVWVDGARRVAGGRLLGHRLPGLVRATPARERRRRQTGSMRQGDAADRHCRLATAYAFMASSRRRSRMFWVSMAMTASP